MATTTRPLSPSPPSADPRSPRPEQGPNLRVGPPPRQRKPALIVVGVLMVLVFAALNAALYLRADQRSEVIAVVRPVPAGRTIVVEDLKRVRITPDPNLRTIPVSAAAAVVGQVAAANLVPGTLLTYDQIGSSRIPGEGQAIAGLDLKGAQMPLPADQLQPGTQVRLVTTPGAGSSPSTGADDRAGEILVQQAEVFSVTVSDTTDSIHVAVVVRQAMLPAVLRAAAAGQVGIAVLPAGSSAPPESATPAQP
jgi:SAF domain